MARYPTYDEYRDKPKKGITKCDELLKRTPKDVQLLATKSQLLTELGDTTKAQTTIDQLLAIQPSTRDLQEIALIEDAVVEHLQANAFPQPLSAGSEVAKIWESAFKAATSMNYKLDLQSLRFTRAIFDNRLQDAQQALIQLKLLAPKNRVFYMTHAAVTQMLSTGSEDLSSRLALMLAKKAVAEKFDEVKDLDCRVPGQIFAMQGKKEELEGIKSGRFGESRQVYDALREAKKSNGEETLAGLKIDDVKFGTPEWLDATIAESKVKFSSLLKDSSDKSALYSFAAESTETYRKAIQSIDQFRYRHVCQLIFLAISALVKTWEEHNETDALLQAAFIGEMLLQNNQQIHEAKVILIHLYMRLDLVTLALKHWTSLSVKEVQLDTMGHVFLANLSTTHPHKATTSTSRNNDPLTITGQALSMYIRCEQKLAECEANVLNNGQTGMILELHELRENLRLSLSRRIFSLEQRRIARLLRSFPLDAAVIHVEPRLTAQWLNAKDNRDFAAAFNYGYSPERALHTLYDKDAAETHILEALVADTAWCLANSALPPIKDTAVLLEKVSSQPKTTAITTSPANTLSLATLYFLAAPTPQTLTTLTSTLATLALSPSQIQSDLKQTYLSLDALRTLIAALKHIEQQHQQQHIKTLPKSELDALRKTAEQGIVELQGYAKERSIKVSGQSVRGGFGKEGSVWALFEAEEVGRFAEGVADSEGKGWEGVGRVK
jgi:N-terminal acetyltransferase B complex non-catalytic subunit